jgi:hypothetical protein
MEEHTQYILARKEGSSVAAAVIDVKDEITISDIQAKRRELPPDLDKVIFATTLDIDSQLEDFANAESILLWDKKKLEEEIGRAVLADSKVDFLTEKPDIEIVDESMDISQDEAMPEVELGPIEIAPIEVKIEAMPKEEIGEAIMKPQITMGDVSEISKKIVQGFRFDLELIPYYLYDYSCELVVEGQQLPQISSGTLAINGLTNSAETWDFEFETVSDMETTHTKLEPKFDEKRAYDTARESAITLNTKEIQTVDDRGAVTIYEKKKVRPKEGAIDIVKRGLVYLPVWCVEGSNGVMIINATTGKIIKEDIYRESDDVYPRSSSSSFSF